MPLNIVRNDIANIKADAIVNSANRHVCCGRGAETSIYKKAGFEELLEARASLGELNVGEIGVTPAFRLNAKYIIHVSAPKWNNGKSGELIALKACYAGALEKAVELGCRSIAFPLLSSGNFRFPKDLALETATGTINEFLQALPESLELTVQLVVFDEKAFEISKKLQDDIEEFISAHYVEEMRLENCSYRRHSRFETDERDEFDSDHWDYKLAKQRSAKLHEFQDIEELGIKSFGEILLSPSEAPTEREPAIKSEKDLEELIKSKPKKQNQAFFEMFDKLVAAKNTDNVTVYKAANLNRDRFSKMQSGQKITRENAIALALGLKLNMDETIELIACAGYTLSSSSRFDLVIEYFVTHQIYDVPGKINSFLAKQGMPTLGNSLKWG